MIEARSRQSRSGTRRPLLSPIPLDGEPQSIFKVHQWFVAQCLFGAGQIGVLGVLVARHSSRTGQPQVAAVPSSANPTAENPPTSASALENTAGAILHRVMPTPSEGALRTVHGRIKIRVRVNVDNEGRVTSAKFLTAGPSKYFARLSMQAAEQWKFTPPLASGQSVSSQWTLLFEFSRGGTEASAGQSKTPR